MVEQAIGRRLFSRGFKREATVPAGLGMEVDRLLEDAALSALSMARKAGSLVTGFAKVDAAIRAGQALAVLHATDASPDGRRKVEQAILATYLGEGPPPVHVVFDSRQMGLALGTENVVHAAAKDSGAGENLIRRILALETYRDTP